jgi:7-cyano-7-deazaguanine synthase
MNQKIVIGLSGGMDSATLLGTYLEQGLEVICCSFKYGSKHEVYELQAATQIVDFYNSSKKYKHCIHYIIDLRQPFLIFKSNLLKTGEEIPEGHYQEESMRKTVVPGRNLIIASFLAGIAESIDAKLIGLGVHAGDHHIYPDCRPGFIASLRNTLRDSTEGKVHIVTPFLDWTKADILKFGYSFSLPVPYYLTRTCYKDQESACGKCGSCRERLEAFEYIGIKDPVNYE